MRTIYYLSLPTHSSDLDIRPAFGLQDIEYWYARVEDEDLDNAPPGWVEFDQISVRNRFGKPCHCTCLLDGRSECCC